MCNLSKGVWEEGFVEGYLESWVEGYTESLAACKLEGVVIDIKESREEIMAKGMPSAFKALVEASGCSAEHALIVMKIPEEEWPSYQALLETP